MRGSTTLTCLVNLVMRLAHKPFSKPINAPPSIQYNQLSRPIHFHCISYRGQHRKMIGRPWGSDKPPLWSCGRESSLCCREPRSLHHWTNSLRTRGNTGRCWRGSLQRWRGQPRDQLETGERWGEAGTVEDFLTCRDETGEYETLSGGQMFLH